MKYFGFFNLTYYCVKKRKVFKAQLVQERNAGGEWTPAFSHRAGVLALAAASPPGDSGPLVRRQWRGAAGLRKGSLTARVRTQVIAF